MKHIIQLIIICLTINLSSISCGHPVPRPKYFMWEDPILQRQSIEYLFSKFIEFAADTGDFPSSPVDVLEYYPENKFYSYIDSFSLLVSAEDATIHVETDKELKFANIDVQLSSNEIDHSLIYYVVKHVKNGSDTDYIGMILLYIGYPIYAESYGKHIFIKGKHYNVDCLDWEVFIGCEDQSAIPYSIMQPDGKEDNILIRLDYYIDFPLNDLNSLYLERR